MRVGNTSDEVITILHSDGERLQKKKRRAIVMSVWHPQTQPRWACPTKWIYEMGRERSARCVERRYAGQTGTHTSPDDIDGLDGTS